MPTRQSTAVFLLLFALCSVAGCTSQLDLPKLTVVQEAQPAMTKESADQFVCPVAPPTPTAIIKENGDLDADQAVKLIAVLYKVYDDCFDMDHTLHDLAIRTPVDPKAPLLAAR